MSENMKVDIVSNDFNHLGFRYSDQNQNGSPDMQIHWSAFEHMVCLNLKEREDRLLHSVEEFAKVGILDRVEFQINERSPKGGLYGCFESHLKAIRSAYDRGYSNVLILEDDCSFRNGWRKVIADCADFVRSANPLDWEFLNVNGLIAFGVEDCPWNRSILNGKSFLTHIYCLSRMGMKRMLELYKNGPSLDYGVDIVYLFQLPRAFVHKQHSTIIQVPEELGTDNDFPTWISAKKTFDPQLLKFIQTNIVPLAFPFQSAMHLFITKYVPWSVRPWLVDATLLTTKLIGQDILVVRNGKEESFKWTHTYLTYLFRTMVGVVAFFHLLLPSSHLPNNMSRLNLCISMMKLNKY